MKRNVGLKDRLMARRKAPYPVAIGLLAFILSMLPYAAGFLFTPHGQTFLGIFNNELDISQYLAAIRQGAHGQLIFSNQYTEQHISPVLMYTLYTLAGFATSPLHPASMVVYLLLLVIGLLLVLHTSWLLCRTFHPQQPLVAFILVLFAGGLYSLGRYQFDDLHALYGTRLLLDGNDSTLLSALQLPHAAWALAVEMSIIYCYVQWLRTTRIRRLIALGLLTAGLGLLVPFLVLTIYGVVGLHAVGTWFINRHTWQATRHTAMVLAALAPAVALPLYYWRVFSFDPLWRRTLMTDPERPHVVTIVTCYGLLCGGVFVGWYRYRRSLHRPHVPLLVLWIVVTAILVLSPLPQPKRYLLGLTIPLALLCAYAVLAMPQRARLPSLVLLCVSSVATICTLLWIALGHRYSGYYLDAGGTKIVAYLATHTTAADVILGPERLCDIAVGVTPARVVLGHYYETPNVLQMRRTTAIYDAPSTSARARALFEAAHHVTVNIEATDQSAVLHMLTFSSRYRHVYSSHGYSIFVIVPKASELSRRSSLAAGSPT